MSAPWLQKLLHELAELDLHNAGDREQAAETIMSRLPRDVLVEAIKSGARATLKVRGIADAADDYAREIANNSAANVLFLLDGAE